MLFFISSKSQGDFLRHHLRMLWYFHLIVQHWYWRGTLHSPDLQNESLTIEWSLVPCTLFLNGDGVLSLCREYSQHILNLINKTVKKLLMYWYYRKHFGLGKKINFMNNVKSFLLSLWNIQNVVILIRIWVDQKFGNILVCSAYIPN